MNTGAYGGCTADCHYGGWCGDAIKQDEEECDNGVGVNGPTYISDGGASGACTVGCKLAHFCGDKNIDAANGEQCDEGEKNGMGACQLGCTLNVK
jgi:hypothetical protein